ncbi:MAG: hypothetical protein Q7V01_02400 [Vicinamibacterales bacterium]|nr:hypothetical protein [Vicinamibacterales bacterium]
MLRSKKHPGNDALVRWYMADRGLEALEPADEAVVRHVGGCTSCAGRYDAICRDLDAAAAVSADAADAAFTPERLMLQRDRILRRLDTQGARVLAFPVADVTGGSAPSSRPMLRWVAAAAAAGLVVGLLAGRMFHLGEAPADTMASRQGSVTRAIGPSEGQVRTAALARLAGDDVFMSEVDSALSAPRTPELEAIDAMTLRVQTGPPRR